MADTMTSRRAQVRTASGLNVLAGIWLFISAFVVYANTPVAGSNAVCGIVVVVLAAIRAFGAYEAAWISWLNALVGVWVFISQWAVMGTGPNGPTPGMMVNNCITGGLIIVLALWSAMASPAVHPGYPGATRPSLGA